MTFLFQYQELRIKAVFPFRLKFSCDTDKIIYGDMCVAVPSIAPAMTSVMMKKQKRDERNHQWINSLSACFAIAATHSDMGNGWEIWEFCPVETHNFFTYWLARFVVLFCTLITSPSLSFWLYQNLVQTLQPWIRRTRQKNPAKILRVNCSFVLALSSPKNEVFSNKNHCFSGLEKCLLILYTRDADENQLHVPS